MIKDIVVNLQLGERGGPAADYAVSLAGTLEAHITGIAFVYDAIIPMSGVAYIPADVVDALRRDNEAAAKAAIGRFAAATARAGVTAEPRLLNTDHAGAGRKFSRIARGFDLAVVGQAEPGTSVVEEMIAESALFEAGRPVIFVPYIQKAPLKLDNVMVCWDGSRSAARAIADAMPLLERAGHVEVVIVGNESGKQDEYPRCRHGPAPRPSRTKRGSRAHYPRRHRCRRRLAFSRCRLGAEFIVMGGYGHSRLREFVLGGVTRGILHSMTVPVLMSH